MGTRYVWEKYNVNATTTNRAEYEDFGKQVLSDQYWKLFDPGNQTSFFLSMYDLAGAEKINVPATSSTTITIPAGKLLIGSIENDRQVELVVYAQTECNCTLKTAYFDNTNQTVFTVQRKTGTLVACTFRIGHTSRGWNITIKQSKGSLIGGASSNTSSTYPSEGITNGYWYTYIGSDMVDPATVTIPSSVNGGQNAAITITPSTGKVYGGTISYAYSYALNGTSTWNSIATTTAATQNVAVPYGSTSLQARVQASDNMGYVSADFVYSNTATVINNEPPTAPGSISVSNVVSGEQCTITITAATDPDGTVASYIYQRSVDGSAWTQIANVNALTYNDTISASWGTVAYRVCAVDDKGASGPFVTSETTTIKDGWVIISGPDNDMGNQPVPFDFVFSVSVTGQISVSTINVTVTLDGEQVYTGTPNSGEQVSINIDTRLLAGGNHAIQVTASKENYLEANGTYSFTVPAYELPTGGNAEQLENPSAQPIFPITLARYVIGNNGKDVNTLINEIASTITTTSSAGTMSRSGALNIITGDYIGTGTYGDTTPSGLVLGFVPQFVVVIADTANTISNETGLIWCGQTGSTSGLTFSATQNGINWYGISAAAQLNTANTVYHYFAIG